MIGQIYLAVDLQSTHKSAGITVGSGADGCWSCATDKVAALNERARLGKRYSISTSLSRFLTRPASYCATTSSLI